MIRFKVQYQDDHEQRATATLRPGHVITRVYEREGFYGGHTRMQAVSHCTRYTCTCGEDRYFLSPPHSAQQRQLEHDDARRAVRDWLSAENRHHVLVALGITRTPEPDRQGIEVTE